MYKERKSGMGEEQMHREHDRFLKAQATQFDSSTKDLSEIFAATVAPIDLPNSLQQAKSLQTSLGGSAEKYQNIRNGISDLIEES